MPSVVMRNHLDIVSRAASYTVLPASQNTKSEDTLFLKFAKAKDVDHRAL